MTNKLKWGIQPPEGVTVAWGARAIYTENKQAYDLNHTKRGAKRKRGLVNYFNVELLWDRKDQIGDTAELCKWLDKTGMPRLIKECSEKYVTPESNEIIEFIDGDFTLRASPSESHGYLYIGAWSK